MTIIHYFPTRPVVGDVSACGRYTFAWDSYTYRAGKATGRCVNVTCKHCIRVMDRQGWLCPCGAPTRQVGGEGAPADLCDACAEGWLQLETKRHA